MKRYYIAQSNSSIKQMLAVLLVIMIVLGYFIYNSLPSYVTASNSSGSSATACRNSFVGYNWGSAVAKDPKSAVKWMFANGDVVTVLIDTNGWVQGLNMSIGELASYMNAEDRLIVRLWNYHHVLSEQEINTVVNVLNSSLGGVKSRVYIEIANEFNWNVENENEVSYSSVCERWKHAGDNAINSLDQVCIDHLIKTWGSYFRSIGSKLTAKGFNVLLPPINPNLSGDYRVINPSMLGSISSYVSGINWAGVSIHVYANENNIIPQAESAHKMTIQMYGGQYGKLPVFVTELGLIGEGGVSYDPVNAPRLWARAWGELASNNIGGGVRAATPLIADPTPEGNIEQGGEALINSGQIGNMVGTLSCHASNYDWIEIIGSSALQGKMMEEMIAFSNSLPCISGMLDCSGYAGLCEDYWSCCSGVPVYGGSGVCIYAEWGDTSNLPVCDPDMDNSLTLVCSQKNMEVHGKIATIPSSEGEEVPCDCVGTLNLDKKSVYPVCMSVPVSIGSRMGPDSNYPCELVGARPRSGNLLKDSTYSFAVPTKNLDLLSVYATKEVKIKVDNVIGSGPEGEAHVAVEELEDAPREEQLIVNIVAWYSMPGLKDSIKPRNDVYTGNACEGYLSALMGNSVPYCLYKQTMLGYLQERWTGRAKGVWEELENGIKQFVGDDEATCKVKVTNIILLVQKPFEYWKYGVSADFLFNTPNGKNEHMVGEVICVDQPVTICGKSYLVRKCYDGIENVIGTYGFAGDMVSAPSTKECKKLQDAFVESLKGCF